MRHLFLLAALLALAPAAHAGTAANNPPSTGAGGAVTSVNGQTGAVTIPAWSDQARIGADSPTVGGNPYANPYSRIISPGTLADIEIRSSGVSFWGIVLTGSGAKPAIKLLGSCLINMLQALNGGGVSQVPVSGSTGNTDVGMDLIASRGSVILLDPAHMPIVTGTAGDVRLGDGSIMTWASLASAGTTTDTKGNRIIAN